MTVTDATFKEGLAYAESNFRNDNASHLKVDKQLIREKFDLDGKKILDFGCGMGGMTLWYASNWDCEVVGLDIDANHITIAEALKDKYKKDNVSFLLRDVLEEPLDETEQFDYIFLNDVAEHIPLPILKEILTQLGKSLKKGGRIFVTYPPWQSPYASHVTHITKIPWSQYLPRPILYRMIEKNNLRLVGEHESNLLEAYEGLNHLTHSKLMKLADAAQLQLVFRKSHSLVNNYNALKEVNLNVYPFAFLVSKEFVLLEKAG